MYPICLYIHIIPIFHRRCKTHKTGHSLLITVVVVENRPQQVVKKLVFNPQILIDILLLSAHEVYKRRKDRECYRKFRWLAEIRHDLLIIQGTNTKLCEVDLSDTFSWFQCEVHMHATRVIYLYKAKTWLWFQTSNYCSEQRICNGEGQLSRWRAVENRNKDWYKIKRHDVFRPDFSCVILDEKSPEMNRVI